MSNGESVEPREEPLDPVAFAEKWYEDHPEVLDEYNKNVSYLNSLRKPRGKKSNAKSEDAQGQGSDV